MTLDKSLNLSRPHLSHLFSEECKRWCLNWSLDVSQGEDAAWVILSEGPFRPGFQVHLNPGLTFQLSDSGTAFLPFHLGGTDSRGLRMD